MITAGDWLCRPEAPPARLLAAGHPSPIVILAARRWVPRSRFARRRMTTVDGRQAGGGGLDAGAVGEDALGRGGAEAVAGTEEEEVGQRSPATDVASAFLTACPRNVSGRDGLGPRTICRNSLNKSTGCRSSISRSMQATAYVV